MIGRKERAFIVIYQVARVPPSGCLDSGGEGRVHSPPRPRFFSSLLHRGRSPIYYGNGRELIRYRERYLYLPLGGGGGGRSDSVLPLGLAGGNLLYGTSLASSFTDGPLCFSVTDRILQNNTMTVQVIMMVYAESGGKRGCCWFSRITVESWAFRLCKTVHRN